MKIIYHKNCNDGSAAALAAWMVYGDSAEYIAAQHGETPPDVAGEDVYILDFSYPEEVLADIGRAANFVTVIDHHKTSLDLLDMNIVDNIAVIIDMERSGAVMAWQYFHPDKPVPFFFQLIQDRDLWQLKYAGTKAVYAALQLTPDFREWEKFVDGEKLDELVASGAPIVTYMEQQALKIIDTPPIVLPATGDLVPYYNAPKFFGSELLGMALDRYPQCPYAVAYFDDNGVREYSLRSRKGSDVDVSEIAKRFGGGGHKHAAGFRTSIDAL